MWDDAHARWKEQYPGYEFTVDIGGGGEFILQVAWHGHRKRFHRFAANDGLLNEIDEAFVSWKAEENL